MAILFLGFAISDSINDFISVRDRYPQVAAHKLQWNIIRGIEGFTGDSVDLLSAVPVSNFPLYPTVFFGFSRWSHGCGAADRCLPFINIALLKHLSRFLSSFVLLVAWLLKKRQQDRQILVYAMHSPFMVSALLATFFLGGQVFLVVPDMPQFMDLGMQRSLYRKVAKKIDAWFMHRMLCKMAGLIVLTRYVAEDMVGVAVPSLVVEGAVAAHELETPLPMPGLDVDVQPADKIIMYTGALTGLELLLSAFTLLPDPSYRLWISGRGTMEPEITAAATLDRRIVYWGMLSTEELSRKTSQATVLVNPRRSSTPYMQYSFPSKLLEYMAAGRPVISTDLPSIPDDYHEYLFLLRDETPAGLAKLLTSVCAKSPEELGEFGQKAREFVLREKNYLRQGERIYRFMQSCKSDYA